MAIIIDPVNDFNWAYKGFQYPLPKSWKYVVRVEDQLQWLLQGLMRLNDSGVSVDYLDEELGRAIDALTSQLADELERIERELGEATSDLEQKIAEAEYGYLVSRNPVTGSLDRGYVVFKQMYDMLRVDALTWDELDATGMTWDALHDSGYSWFEVDMFSNVYWGDGKPRAKYTPVSHIDANTPGYFPGSGEPAGEGVIARTWGDLLQYGFLTDK